MTVNAVEASRDNPITITAASFSLGTILSGGSPRVALVLRSKDGEYMGHLELNATGANILAEEIRQAAEAAETTLEEE